MLGYVVTYRPEMKVREAELYKAYYCGICKSAGRRTGQVTRMLLSYDAAFLAVVLDSFIDEIEQLSRERCFVHPQKKSAVCYSESIDYAADIMVMLAWYKLQDDIEDENSTKAKIASQFIKSSFGQIKLERPELCRTVDEQLKKMKKLESEKCANLDEIAEAFAEIMKTIFVFGLDNMRRKGDVAEFLDSNSGEWIPRKQPEWDVAEKLLARVGYHLGKWIYLMDAYDDLEDNINTGAYNPLIYRFGYSGEATEIFRKKIKADVERNLIIYLDEIGKAFDLADIRKNKGIIENIVYVGLLKKTEALLNNNQNIDSQQKGTTT